MATTQAKKVNTATVVAAQAGDSRALERLIAEHYAGMCRLAMRYTHDADLAKDAVQDACIQVMRYFGQLRDADSFKSWMSRIVINCVRLHQRRNKRFVAFGDNFERTQEVKHQQPDELVMTREELEIVDTFLKDAQNDERKIFLQLYVGGDAVATVSERTGISVAALKTRVHRARRRLKTYMDAKHESGVGLGGMSV